MLEKLVAPSILSADFGKLQEEVDSIRSADWMHIDVMDGLFVPNLTFGAPVLRTIKTNLVKDVHLMVEKPWLRFDEFAKIDADYITFHVEACDKEHEPLTVITDIHRRGIKAGISLKPATPVSTIAPFLTDLDLVLIMSVEPGFGGQSFMPETLEKIRFLREKKPSLHIAIDGGINAETGKLAREAGADVLVAGSFVFGTGDREEAIATLR